MGFATKKTARESVLSVRLTAEQDAILAAAAAARGVGKAELVRVAIDQYLAAPSSKRKRATT